MAHAPVGVRLYHWSLESRGSNTLPGSKKSPEKILEFERELATNMGIVVNSRRCPQNHPCPSVMVCPVGALRQKGFMAPKVDIDKCIECEKCIKFCPMKAIRST